jgi:hypothetical protein
LRGTLERNGHFGIDVVIAEMPACKINVQPLTKQVNAGMSFGKLDIVAMRPERKNWIYDIV